MDADKAAYDVSRMAALLKVSRSGYYAWKRREQAGPSPAQRRRQALTDKIIKFHADSGHVYGSPRILADLRDDGETVSRKTATKLMRSNRIVGISPRGWTPGTTWPDTETALPDLVGRRFDHGQLNRVWTSDITNLATGEGWLYLCAVRDGCSRRVSAGRSKTISAPTWSRARRALDRFPLRRTHRRWRPMPRLAPVIKVTLPSRPMVIIRGSGRRD